MDLRERDVTKRIYINNGLRDLKYKSIHTSKAQETFMQASDMLMASVAAGETDAKVIRRVEEAWIQLQDLTQNARSREKQLETAQNDLLNLENKLYMKEGEFYGRLRGLTREALLSTHEAPTDDFTTLSTSSASSTSTASVAHDYYNRVGDLNLLRERLYNFDSEHSRQRIIRDAQRQDGQRPDPPNKVFLQQYFADRETLIHQYIEAKDDMETLRKSCERQGVEVQPPDLPPVLDHSQRYEDPGRNGNLIGNGLNRNFSGFVTQTYSQRRLYLWVKDIQKRNHINPFKPFTVRRPPVDPVRPRVNIPEILGWTIEPIEDYPAVSSYNRLQASSASENSSDTEVPEGADRRSGVVPQSPNSFDGETPTRRHSFPNLSSFLTLGNQMSTDDWTGLSANNLVELNGSSIIDVCAKSVDLPRW